jgi:hypothetical protein
MIYENLEISGSLTSDRVVNRPPKGVRASRPSSPLSGSLYLEESNSGSFLMLYTGVSNINDGWEQIAAQETIPIAFRYRQVLTYSYLAGGYKDSSPWRNVHKTTNSTSQTTHVGELLDYPASYTSGACNKTILFIWSVNENNAFKGPDTVDGYRTSAINMFNDTNYAHQTKFNTGIARSDVATMQKETEFAYLISGGSATIEKFNLSNESYISGFGVSSINDSAGGAAFFDESFGYAWTSGAAIKFNFSNETPSSSTQWGVHQQQKGISSKVGKGYCGNEGSYNGGYNLRRWSNATDTNIGNVSKPHANCGEENFAMGQDWQYMLGNYDGTGQNNTSWQLIYATDTGSNAIVGLAPRVNAGTSSGHCGWR